ncbi:MAG TPA: methylenetetrahydrofolate reductase [NAD(P)H] [Kiritimatiellia bacterium]|nr:methylenetetrahydrofolate reductase [NAD(P)H] [Kiritimatiellia bacterium]
MPDPTIASLLHQASRPLLSFEFFPPKDHAGLEALGQTIHALADTRPDFVTVTYGAGGSTRQRTRDVCELLRAAGHPAVMPHLTCVGSSREDLHHIADDLHQNGYRNIMTLRGDPPKGATTFQAAPDGLAYAVDLVHLLKARHPDFCLGVAAYPETHPEALSPLADIQNLKAKLDAGADFATTQLFFDNQVYFDFVETCRNAGITQPILPGLLPALSLKQVQRMCAMCQASLPSQLEADLIAVGDDPEAAERVGTEWASSQIDELLDRGVPGIHLYILNRARADLAHTLLTRYRLA